MHKGTQKKWRPLRLQYYGMWGAVRHRKFRTKTLPSATEHTCIRPHVSRTPTTLHGVGHTTRNTWDPVWFKVCKAVAITI